MPPPAIFDNDNTPDLIRWLATVPSFASDWPRGVLSAPRKLRVLVVCEYSATVRDAFRARGFDAWSCDLLPTEGDPRWHIQGDAIEVAHGQQWDLMVAHPPCTYLTVSGNKWFRPEFADRFPTRVADREQGAEFFMALYNAPVERVAIENPIGVMSSRFRKPDQVVQPWQYGHGETKATCLWLRGLPKLAPSHRKADLFAAPEPEAREQRLHKLPPSPNRWKERSRTFPGIAAAMADQWGNHILSAAQTQDGPATAAVEILSIHSSKIAVSE
jgi:hypothetical protein